MSGQAVPGSDGLDDQQARRWLAALQTGSADEKAQARWSLAQMFESRGMVSEAVDLLVTNAREGYRDADLFQTLARLYRQLGDEYLAASAALEATRLSGSRPSNDRARQRPPEDETATDAQTASRRPHQASPSPGPSQPSNPAVSRPWRLPLRVAGWITVLATAVAGAAVAAEHPPSAALYLVSAAALGLLLIGPGAARRLVRLPDGPLGDGALLFLCLLTLLAAGALLPRPLTMPRAPTQQNESATPAPIRTPSPSPPSSPTP